eukprot:scaffold501_cov153-Skeletonema_marinoi.AAC.6
MTSLRFQILTLGLTSGTGVVVIVTDQPRKNTNCCDDTRQGRPAAGISTSRKFVGFSLGSWDSLCAFCWMTDETTESRLLYQSYASMRLLRWVITLSSQDMLVRQIDRDEIQTRSTAR